MKRLVVTLFALCCAAAAAFAAPPTQKPVKSAEYDSLRVLEQAVAKDSSKTDNLYKLGVMYLDRDRPQEAVIVLATVVKRRPNDLKAIVNLGAAQDALGNAEWAQELYRRALKASPSDSIASCRLASSLYAGGKQGEAVKLLRDIISEQPGSYCAYFTLGVAFADAGIYRDAIRMWKKVVELAPGSQEALSAQESIDVLDKFVNP